ncbi:hypothetical protein RRG08_001382 [Elysia crispata]|uniref:Uncharacterized protein n=1 Tax=Elysia crispata TaxID=231223 RepID=A0AAE0ZS80_9GAST|nr:hypothetical protein RRG08_001382 [Elysia crispata]
MNPVGRQGRAAYINHQINRILEHASREGLALGCFKALGCLKALGESGHFVFRTAPDRPPYRVWLETPPGQVPDCRGSEKCWLIRLKAARLTNQRATEHLPL